jgi:hypothetical protein
LQRPAVLIRSWNYRPELPNLKQRKNVSVCLDATCKPELTEPQGVRPCARTVGVAAGMPDLKRLAPAALRFK